MRGQQQTSPTEQECVHDMTSSPFCASEGEVRAPYQAETVATTDARRASVRLPIDVTPVSHERAGTNPRSPTEAHGSSTEIGRKKDRKGNRASEEQIKYGLETNTAWILYPYRFLFWIYTLD